MERKEDLILECYLLKGEKVDWLAVIYREEANALKAVSRIRLNDRSFKIRFFSGTNQQDLSEELAGLFLKAAGRYGLTPIHLEYPGGVNERAFVQGLREAQREWRRIQEKAKN